MTEEQVGNKDHVLLPLLNELRDIKGDIVEFGVYAGRTTEKLAESGRIVWALDTFTGIPTNEFTEDIDTDVPGKFAPPEDTIDRLCAFENIRIMPGLFSYTLPSMDQVRVALAYVDCDLMLSVGQCLDWLRTHMVPGGVIVIDDYQSHPGVRTAVNIFLAMNQEADFNGTETIRWRSK